jgi:hypothetical protein
MLEGSLKDFTLDEVLQMISLGEKTGRLVLKGDTPFGRREGSIFFENGQVKDAETEQYIGEPAVVELLNIKEGYFKFAPEDISLRKRSINKSIPDLVLLATSKIDEWGKIKNKISSVDTVFKLSSEGVPDEIHLSTQQWRIISLLGNGLTIREVALKMNKTVIDISKDVYALVALRIVREVGEKNPDFNGKVVKKKRAPRNFILRLIERLKRL